MGVKSWGLACTLGLGIACGEVPTSEQKIINGRVPSEGAFPEVVLLFDQIEGSICTGTFVSPTEVLTAAHCTRAGRADADGKVDLRMALVRMKDVAKKEVDVIAVSESIVRQVGWSKSLSQVNPYDLAILRFPAGYATEVATLASRAPTVGEKIEIVGFGLHASSGAPLSSGIKRVGYNQVTRVSGGLIEFEGQKATTSGDGTQASGSQGDSGGPLFIEGRLAGVTSGGAGGFLSKNITSKYVDLQSTSSQLFLKTHLSVLP